MWAGHPDGFLQVNPMWAGHPDGFLQVNLIWAGHPDGFLQVNPSLTRVGYIIRSDHFKRFIYSPHRLVYFYVGYRVGNSTPELPWQLSYVELVQKHKLNFLLNNYISKKIFQHIIGTGRSRGAFCYSFCSSRTSVVTWEKVAKRGHFS
jgi:hypothetical protein